MAQSLGERNEQSRKQKIKMTAENGQRQATKAEMQRNRATES